MDTITYTVLLLIALTIGLIYRALRMPKRKSKRTTAAESAIYTLHAKQRMEERRVDAAAIEMTLAQPHRKCFDPKQGSIRLERNVAGKTLIVWVVADRFERGELIVKSTAWEKPHYDLQVPDGQMGRVIGKQGATIQYMQNRHGVTIQIVEDSLARIFGEDSTARENAAREISGLFREAVRGDSTRGSLRRGHLGFGPASSGTLA